MMADSQSLPVQSKSPRPSIQINNNEANGDLEDEPQLEIAEVLVPKIDINALKNEILTDGMQVSVASYSYVATKLYSYSFNH